MTQPENSAEWQGAGVEIDPKEEFDKTWRAAQKHVLNKIDIALNKGVISERKASKFKEKLGFNLEGKEITIDQMNLIAKIDGELSILEAQKLGVLSLRHRRLARSMPSIGRVEEIIDDAKLVPKWIDESLKNGIITDRQAGHIKKLYRRNPVEAGNWIEKNKELLKNKGGVEKAISEHQNQGLISDEFAKLLLETEKLNPYKALELLTKHNTFIDEVCYKLKEGSINRDMAEDLIRLGFDLGNTELTLIEHNRNKNSDTAPRSIIKDIKEGPRWSRRNFENTPIPPGVRKRLDASQIKA